MPVLHRIPFNRPTLTGKEFVYVADAIAGSHASADGPYTEKCCSLLSKTLGVPEVVLTTSCTASLEMTAILLDVGPDDEVIVPSFTFVSTANAFVLRGARPIFVDVRSDTLNLDETLLEERITSRTKAIVVVHYGGVAAEMDTILQIANRHGVAVIEDNAHGLFAKYRGKFLGTLGTFGCQSFHETKNISCGEGGALLINDPEQIERAHTIRDKGTNRRSFHRGMVDKYTWVDTGSSYGLSDLLAGFLFAQLESHEAIQARRREIWLRYGEGLQDWAERVGASLPVVPSHCDSSHHLFFVLMPSESARSSLIEHLKAIGILSVFHYSPLHLSPMGVRFGGASGDCPVTESVSSRVLRLPFYNDLSDRDQDEVIAALERWSTAAQ